MSKIESALTGGKKLIAYLTAGYPDSETSYQQACAVCEVGVDILELGLPFSDPIADGPILQAAATKALANGMTPPKYFEFAKKVYVENQIPLVCLTYYNLILHYGLRKFAKSCVDSGVYGVIVPDLPYEHAQDFQNELKNVGCDFIYLISETTSNDRMKKICSFASGFIYVVSNLGTTGERKNLSQKNKKLLAEIRKHTKLPLALGFGIGSAKHVKQALNYGADAAIVGTAIVKLTDDTEKLKRFTKKLLDATK